MKRPKWFLCTAVGAQVLLVVHSACSMSVQASPESQPLLISQADASDQYFEHASEAAQQRAAAVKQLNDVKSSELSIEQQIATLKKIRQAGGSAASSIAREKQLYVLEKSLANDKDYEQRDLATIKSLDQWIAYWQALSDSTQAWDLGQDDQVRRDFDRAEATEDQVQANEQATREGHQYYRSMFKGSASSGGSLVVPVDGWNAIPINR